MRPFLRRVGCLALLLLFLAAATAAPPVSHTHHAGADRHQHSGRQAHAHPHRHTHPHGHKHPHGHAHQQNRSEPVAHSHFSWLFFDWSFPASPSGPEAPNDAALRLPPTVVAAVVAIDLQMTWHGWDHVLLPSGFLTETTGGRGDHQLGAGDALEMPLCGRLCDIARRERSGVRVI